MLRAGCCQGCRGCEANIEAAKPTTSLVCLLVAFQTLPYVPSPSCLMTLYL